MVKPGMPRLYASAGIYPHSTTEADDAALAKLDQLLAEPDVIACGEIGLDYYHEGAPHQVQREGLIRQLEIAAARKRPILIHCRGKDETTDAWDDLFLVLEEFWGRTGLGGIMHCFGGGWEQARRSLDLGFLISFAGNVTYPKAQPLRDVASRVPLDSILVETDAPWLAPAAHRGKRNEPAMVTETAQLLATLLGRTSRRNRGGHHRQLLPLVRGHSPTGNGIGKMPFWPKNSPGPCCPGKGDFRLQAPTPPRHGKLKLGMVTAGGIAASARSCKRGPGSRRPTLQH